MTIRLFDTDSHLFRFEASVLQCEPDGSGRFAVILDQTAFFPECGGQYADTGTLSNAAVLDVQQAGGKIIHYTDRPIPTDSIVIGSLDAEKRFARMQNHSGEHIVSGIVHSLFGFDNVGFHLGDGDMTVDYNGVLTREDLDRVEALANEAVTRNLEITAEYPDAHTLQAMTYRSKLELTKNVRIVTIGDVDRCACCAPHVSRTGEIGAIKLLDFEHYKGGVRCHMLCGAWAMADYREKYSNVLKISGQLRVPQAETATAVERLTETLKENEYTLNGLRRRLAQSALQNALANGQICFFADECCDSDSLRYAVDLGKSQAEICAGFLPTNDGFRYCIGSETVDLRTASKSINSALRGRGGGQSSMIQGAVCADRNEIETFFQNNTF